jgi:hypothetical protein
MTAIVETRQHPPVAEQPHCGNGGRFDVEQQVVSGGQTKPQADQGADHPGVGKNGQRAGGCGGTGDAFGRPFHALLKIGPGLPLRETKIRFQPGPMFHLFREIPRYFAKGQGFPESEIDFTQILILPACQIEPGLLDRFLYPQHGAADDLPAASQVGPVSQSGGLPAPQGAERHIPPADEAASQSLAGVAVADQENFYPRHGSVRI